MKSFLQIIILLSALLMGVARAESQFTEAQLIEFGRVILSAPENKEYKAIFWDVKPIYDEKIKVWKFMGGFPVTPGGTIYIFDVRDADGHYCLGWLNSVKASPHYDQFRIQLSNRRKLAQLMAKYRNQ
jgi:hypothetical protein